MSRVQAWRSSFSLFFTLLSYLPLFTPSGKMLPWCLCQLTMACCDPYGIPDQSLMLLFLSRPSLAEDQKKAPLSILFEDNNFMRELFAIIFHFVSDHLLNPPPLISSNWSSRWTKLPFTVPLKSTPFKLKLRVGEASHECCESSHDINLKTNPPN